MKHPKDLLNYPLPDYICEIGNKLEKGYKWKRPLRRIRNNSILSDKLKGK